MNRKIPENLSRIRVSDAVTRTLESGVRQGEAEHSTRIGKRAGIHVKADGLCNGYYV